MDDETEDTIPWLPDDMADLLARIEHEWSALLQVIEPLTPEQMSFSEAGGWSIKDNLAHLAAWEHFMLRYHLAGDPPHEAMGIDEATFKGLDEDGLNDLLFKRNRNRLAEAVLDDLRQSHEQVVRTLGQMNFADLLRPRYEDDPEARPVISWVIGNTYEHYREHRQTIQETIGR